MFVPARNLCVSVCFCVSMCLYVSMYLYVYLLCTCPLVLSIFLSLVHTLADLLFRARVTSLALLPPTPPFPTLQEHPESAIDHLDDPEVAHILQVCVFCKKYIAI